MRRVSLLCIVLVMLLAGTRNGNAAQVSNIAPCASDAPQETTVLDGFLIVHVVCSNVLLEIPPAMLNRSILVYTEFAALSTGGSEYAPGSAINSLAVRWLRIGS